MLASLLYGTREKEGREGKGWKGLGIGEGERRYMEKKRMARIEGGTYYSNIYYKQILHPQPFYGKSMQL